MHVFQKFGFAKPLRIFAIILLFVTGISAMGGGGLLIVDPSGEMMSFPLDLLDKSPFKNYLIPGIILFVTLGIFSLTTITAVLLRLKFYERLISLQGLILIGWLSIELIFNPNFFEPILHYSLYAIGFGLVLIGYRLHSIFSKEINPFSNDHK